MLTRNALVFFAHRALAVFVTLFATFCVTSKEKVETADPQAQLNKDEEAKLEEYKAEVEIGRNMAGRLLQFYGSYSKKSVLKYVNTVGTYVASYSDYPDRRYMIAILESESVNAFACPGGYILVTLGALRLAQTEAELAMILGHEVAHVGKRHMLDTLKKMNEKEMEDAAADLESKKHIDEYSRLRQRPEPPSSESSAMVARYLSGSAGAGLSIIKAAKAGMAVILEKGLDKELELEADHEGVKYAIKAGYEPNALYNYLDRIAERKKSLNMAVLEKTHPSTDERQKQIVKLLKELNADQIVGASGQKRLQLYLKGLPALKTQES